jgi:hypothetical protein
MLSNEDKIKLQRNARKIAAGNLKKRLRKHLEIFRRALDDERTSLEQLQKLADDCKTLIGMLLDPGNFALLDGPTRKSEGHAKFLEWLDGD